MATTVSSRSCPRSRSSATRALGDERGQPAGPLAQLIGASQSAADVVAAERRELGTEGDHIGIETGEPALELRLVVGGRIGAVSANVVSFARSAAISRPAT